MEGLPYELLALIFRHVVGPGQVSTVRDWLNCRLVCKQWDSIANNPNLVEPPESRTGLIFLAKSTEEAEMFEEMVKIVRRRAEGRVSYSKEERNLLAVAYKNVIGKKRAAWRVIQSIVEKNNHRASVHTHVLAKDLLIRIEMEIEAICDEVIKLTRQLLSWEQDVETQTMFWKMQGDFGRYVSEIAIGEKRNERIDATVQSYEKAKALALASLKTTNAVRLGLFLNYAVFHYEVLLKPVEAYQMMEDSFNAAMGEIDTLTEENYKDSTSIMQLMRDNLTLYCS